MAPLRRLDTAGDSVRQVIRAYHGSPYDWDRVDMSMVGKGEGPLAEGFGLYTSSDPNQANWYRHRTAKLRRRILARDMQNARATGDQELLSQAQELAAMLQREQPHGRTYELEIATPEASLINWDSPLSAQSPSVQEAVSRLLPGAMDDGGKMTGAMAYRALSGGSLFDNATVRAQRDASARLFDAGVPGHSYVHGERNYVFYPGTEDQIRILRKY